MSSFFQHRLFSLSLTGLVTACLATVLLAAPALAQTDDQGRCDLAVEPAATLLLPYFEVDFNDPDGITTLVSINNAWSEPALVNLTFWTDFGIPTLYFPVYLTGYDLVTLNLRDIFLGNIPITADAGSDPLDNISPHGSHPEWDGSFPNCDVFFPFFQNPAIPPNLLDWIRSSHTGQPNSGTGLCDGQDHNDGHARGFVTMDNVRECTLINPQDLVTDPLDTPYFVDGGQGVASNDNQLWGDFYLVDTSEDSAIGESLVHVQAFGDTESGPWQEGDATFYGRFVDGTAIDNREPLPSIFGMRYLSGGAFSGGTELIAWRETPVVESVTCDGIQLPDPLPLGQREAYAFNEEEEVADLCFQPGCPVCSPPFLPIFFNCLPFATQRIDIADDPFFTPPGYDAGWLYLDLNQRFPEDAVRQGWVLSQVSASGRFSVGLPAVSLHSACDGLPEYLSLHQF